MKLIPQHICHPFFLASAVLLVANCGSATFVGTQKKRPQPSKVDPVPSPEEPAVAVIATETPAVVADVQRNPSPSAETTTPVLTTPAVKMYVTELGEEALYKNCLHYRMQGAQDWTKIVCSKEGAQELGAIPIPMKQGCNKIQFMIETIRPKKERECISKLQANPKASCNYDGGKVINNATPMDQPERYTFTYTESGILLGFEDRKDGDDNDIELLIGGDFDLNLEIEGTNQRCQ